MIDEINNLVAGSNRISSSHLSGYYGCCNFFSRFKCFDWPNLHPSIPSVPTSPGTGNDPRVQQRGFNRNAIPAIYILLRDNPGQKNHHCCKHDRLATSRCRAQVLHSSTRAPGMFMNLRTSSQFSAQCLP